MSKKNHRKKDRLLNEIRMEVPPDYSDVMPEAQESETPKELGVRAGAMTIDSILYQLASLKDNAESFLHTPWEDTDDIWLADIAAIEAATAILSALQDEGVADAEKVKDLIFDYELSQKEIRELHRKFIEPVKVQHGTKNGYMIQICPECGGQLPTSCFYEQLYCGKCGKRINRPGEGNGKQRRSFG